MANRAARDEDLPLFDHRPRTSPSLAELERELNEQVYKLLGLRDHERWLVEDLVHVRMPLVKGKVTEEAISKPTPSELQTYAAVFQAELDAFVANDPELHHEVTLVHDPLSAMIEVRLTRQAEAGKRRPRVLAADEVTSREFTAIRRKLRKQHSQWVYFDRNLRIFSGRRTYLFKPMQRLQWTRSQALLDAARSWRRLWLKDRGMAISNQRRQPRRLPQRDDYLPSFVIHAHQLLKLGYDKLNPAEFAAAREETITGSLTAAMKSVLRSRTAPEWTADLTVHDEVHVEDGIRRGKRRLRIDIEFEQVRRGPRPIFQFEAKRLRSAASLHAYLGPGGLGRFLDGRYAKDQDIAGMLGYIQSGTVEQRAAQLGEQTRQAPQHAEHGPLALACPRPEPSDLPDTTPTHRPPRPDHDTSFAPGLLLNCRHASPQRRTPWSGGCWRTSGRSPPAMHGMVDIHRKPGYDRARCLAAGAICRFIPPFAWSP